MISKSAAKQLHFNSPCAQQMFHSAKCFSHLRRFTVLLTFSHRYQSQKITAKLKITFAVSLLVTWIRALSHEFLIRRRCDVSCFRFQRPLQFPNVSSYLIAASCDNDAVIIPRLILYCYQYDFVKSTTFPVACFR